MWTNYSTPNTPYQNIKLGCYKGFGVSTCFPRILSSKVHLIPLSNKMNVCKQF